ncbi:hypothetical protein [Paenibacillus silvae]|uniref:Ni2+-binding GTPase n=1 Tax=Paenibacillus silvae TaxID=1325358 RepID=A0ABQ1YZS9_9BACL|nr:hypothetical protein [Paenibacillus silvae]MCK6077312.1 hypothetical protein [Paenibacillus silvae]MCK6151574.1 hypothetical protein [Paenibacillus silvae]MCK6269998.1 hypothetical protein [Paenibacillus silvae]GGH42969.1 hypothetical protein GCM10008014_03520 [Paenibacillus silvae]
MNEVLNSLKQRYKELQEQGKLDEAVQTLFAELMAEAEKLQASNLTLRRTILKSSSKESRMSTKLRDALYE